jgi:hypothetical protein
LERYTDIEERNSEDGVEQYMDVDGGDSGDDSWSDESEGA